MIAAAPSSPSTPRSRAPEGLRLSTSPWSPSTAMPWKKALKKPWYWVSEASLASARSSTRALRRATAVACATVVANAISRGENVRRASPVRRSSAPITRPCDANGSAAMAPMALSRSFTGSSSGWVGASGRSRGWPVLATSRSSGYCESSTSRSLRASSLAARMRPFTRSSSKSTRAARKMPSSSARRRVTLCNSSVTSLVRA